MLTSVLLALAVSGLPVFNIDKACRTDTEAAQEDRSAYQICLNDEDAARAKIVAEWSRYPIGARTTCSSEQGDDLDGSYVELMTCLEIEDWMANPVDMGQGAAAGSRAVGGSPLTPSQIGSYSGHPLGGVPGAHFH
jgi:hypothetical protein